MKPITANEAVRNAVASVEIEGYRVSEDEKKTCLDFASGNLTKEQFIKSVLERVNI